jgi:alpha-amylase
MASVCFYFQVHQPFRLRRYSVFDTDRHYFDDLKNAEIMRKVAEKCYLPANQMMLETIRMHEGRFRIAFSITGVALEQFEMYAPEVIKSFQDLNSTGCVEFLDETYYHSLAFLYSREEFRSQVELHRRRRLILRVGRGLSPAQARRNSGGGSRGGDLRPRAGGAGAV